MKRTHLTAVTAISARRYCHSSRSVAKHDRQSSTLRIELPNDGHTREGVAALVQDPDIRSIDAMHAGRAVAETMHDCDAWMTIDEIAVRRRVDSFQ